jgi:hypothetical protein
LIWNDNQSVYFTAKHFNASIRLFGTTLSFEPERTSHDPNCKSFQIFGNSSYYWSSSRARATALTGGYENHVCTAKCRFDLI